MDNINFSIKTNKNNDEATLTCNKYTLELIGRALHQRGCFCFDELNTPSQADKYFFLNEKLYAILETMKESK